MKWFVNLQISTKILTMVLLVTVISGTSEYLFSSMANPAYIFAGIILISGIGYYLVRSITVPLKYISEYIAKMANGEELEVIRNVYKGEFGVLINNLNEVRNSLYALLDETGRLHRAGSEGKLNVRGEVHKLKGGYADILTGINNTLDAIVEPINEIQQVLDKVIVNDYTTAVKGKYLGRIKELTDNVNGVRERLLSIQDAFVKVSNGDFSRLEEFDRIGKRSENDRMMPAVAGMMRTVLSIIQEVEALTKAATAGNLDVRGEAGKFNGDYMRIVVGFNSTLDAMVAPLKDAMSVLERFAVNDYLLNMTGDYRGSFSDFARAINDVQQRLLSVQKICNNIGNGNMSDLDDLRKIGKRSENDMLIPSFINMIEAIQSLYVEIGVLTDAVTAGKLNTRGDSDKFKGNYAEIIQGLNNLVDAFMRPMDESKEVLAKMSVNDYTTEMTGQYNGMLKEFAESINLVRARVLSVQDCFIKLAKGDTTMLEMLMQLGKRSENDRLIPAGIATMTAIKELINEVGLLASSAEKGELNVRGNIDKFEGGYKEIICGMNNTMEGIVKPIHEASIVMQEMSKGNLTVSMEGDYKGDYSSIKEALNFTIKSFNEVLNDINNAASQVASGAKQVSDSSQSLSHGSTEQASSIEQLTASIEEISSQTKQNAVNANQANELAEDVKEKAAHGNKQMGEMLKAMEEINESSNNISKIIKVIDEIAFQTNILALNAAVEAARAGQHGKGFAVVAEEVRNLAARSADAAKETTTMIEGSIKKVEGGTVIANNTAQELNAIVDGITRAADLVGQIALASNEQASGIAQINQGVMQVSQVVQTNSATSEEGAAASEELSSQAEVLKEMVDKFKLRKEKLDIHHTEHMENKQYQINKAAENNKNDGSSKVKISLNDREFGKY